jgi:hypothetical protein
MGYRLKQPVSSGKLNGPKKGQWINFPCSYWPGMGIIPQLSSPDRSFGQNTYTYMNSLAKYLFPP